MTAAARNRIYYWLKPYLPSAFRFRLRRVQARRTLVRNLHQWPINPLIGQKPRDWPGWPQQRQFSVVLTHDVEGPAGLARVRDLAEVEISLGFCSAFNFVPEGSYGVPDDLRSWLTNQGFEVGVHDLHHDGKLYSSRKAFQRRSARINEYLRNWNAVGFRSGFMHHQLDWLHDLDIEYDASTFDVDPFEPQPDGTGTIFPFWVPVPSPIQVGSQGHGRFTNGPSDRMEGDSGRLRTGYIELPYTLAQDSTLFLFLKQPDIQSWISKLDWIAEHGGMALVNVHPDYIAWHPESRAFNRYPLDHYRHLLEHIRDRYPSSAWNALPRQVSDYVRKTHQGTGPRQPRHIGMVSYSDFESDNRVLRYAQTLAQQGDLVEVLSLVVEPNNLASPSRNPTLAPTDNLPAQRPPPHEERTPVVSEPGIRVHYVQKRKRNERTKFDYLLRLLGFCWNCSRRLTRLHRLHPFDLIHVHTVPDFLVFSAWYPRRQGTRIILDLHDLLPEFYQSKFKIRSKSFTFKLLLLCERLSCQFADHVIVSNHIWQQRVAARSAAPGRCSALVNHVNEQVFRPQTNATPDFSYPIVIFPGGLQHHQGVHVAIHAFKILNRRFPDARFHIIGDGPERESLIKLSESLQLSDVVRFFPPVPLAEVAAFLQRAQVGVVPKLADGFGNEAYSTKIMEFMATGLPVVASRTRIDEFYYGNGQVYFFRSGDANDLARALGEVLEDPLLRQQLIAQGLQYSQKNNWTAYSREYTNLVDSLLSNSNSSDSISPPPAALLGVRERSLPKVTAAHE